MQTVCKTSCMKDFGTLSCSIKTKMKHRNDQIKCSICKQLKSVCTSELNINSPTTSREGIIIDIPIIRSTNHDSGFYFPKR